MSGVTNDKTGSMSRERKYDLNIFFCKLFEDMIVGEVCILRRRELNNRDKFSCSGCSKDTLSGTRAGLNFCTLAD